MLLDKYTVWLVVCLSISITGIRSPITPIEDGLMVTKTSDVHEVRMEYEVVIQEPNVPPAFLSALQQAKRGLNTMLALRKIE